MSLYRLRNILIAAIMIIVAFILQDTIISKIPVLGCAPNILLIITFVYGYCEGKIPGMVVGIFSGLLIDIFFSEYLGFNALILMITGYISGMWKSYFYSDDFYIPMAALVCNNILYFLAYMIFGFILRGHFEVGYYLLHMVLPEFLMTFIAGVILYKPCSALVERLKV